MDNFKIKNIVINDQIVEAITDLQERGYAAEYAETCKEAIDMALYDDDYKTAEDRISLIRQLTNLKEILQSFELKGDRS